MEFMFNVAPRVFFGPGKVKDVGEIAGNLGAKKVFCVYDKGVAKVADKVVGHLKTAGITVVEFSDVVTNPSDTLVEAAVQRCKEAGADLIVAVGGGSAIDTAKAINILLTNPAPINQYDGLNKVKNPTRPLIAIPTTAGTGSEVTEFTIITDTKRYKKMVIVGFGCSTTIAIADPELTVGMPPLITASTGMDALTHAVEAYVSILHSIPSDINALKAINLIVSSIKEATCNGTNMQARNNMLLGSMLAGFAFNNAVLGLAHGLAHPLSVRCNLAHGIANSIMLPHVMEYNACVVPERTADIGRAMGLDVTGMPQEEIVALVVGAIHGLNKELEVPTLSQTGVQRNQFRQIAEDCLRDASEGSAAMFNPRKPTLEDCIAILEKAY